MRAQSHDFLSKARIMLRTIRKLAIIQNKLTSKTAPDVANFKAHIVVHPSLCLTNMRRWGSAHAVWWAAVALRSACHIHSLVCGCASGCGRRLVVHARVWGSSPSGRPYHVVVGGRGGKEGTRDSIGSKLPQFCRSRSGLCAHPAEYRGARPEDGRSYPTSGRRRCSAEGSPVVVQSAHMVLTPTHQVKAHSRRPRASPF